ncbi:cell division protein FtsX [Desulfovermiculus halophilus]|uniref:cell division protein FtsX n=1 Tax=Desulfovermiculus halophilus TaxID=339722 RepID=UPI0005523019|nr:permease-like cell division protein FtsX [Desulfovermiculus halophilus]
MFLRMLGSELISWKYIRTEQFIALFGVSLIVFLALTAYVGSKCIHSLAASSTADIQMQVFWSADANQDQVNQAWESIEEMQAVLGITTYTPDQALAEMTSSIGPDLNLSWVEDNPLPPTAVLQVGLGSAQTAQALAKEIRGLSGVDAVHTSPLEVTTAAAWQQITSTVLWPLITVLLLTQAVLLANTVRLTIAKVQADIQVLRLVGATRIACQAPILARMLGLTLAGTTLALGGAAIIHWQISSVLSAPPFHHPCPFVSWPELAGMYAGVCAVSALSCIFAIRTNGM